MATVQNQISRRGEVMNNQDRAAAIGVIENFAEELAARAVAANNDGDKNLYDGLRVVVQIALAAADVIETFGKDDDRKKRTGFS